ncbi:MAG: histidine kinase [Acidobacteria bacterium]|nr:histidine kinase [Acidobacteriota bacterium]
MELSSAARKRLVSAAVIFGVWALYGLNSAIHTHYQTMLAGRPIYWGRAFFGEFSFCMIWALVTPLILWLRKRWPIARPHLLRSIVYHFFAAALCIIFTKIAWDILYRWPSGWVKTGFTWKKVTLSVGQIWDSGILLYAMVLLAGYAVEYYNNFRQEQLTSARLRAQIAEAQLRALRMQIHPHFLFNTLHTISALVQEDPHAAERTIARLSDLLRITLDKRDDAEVPLSRELQFLDLYLEIEQTRYEDRLAVRREIAPDAGDALVPNFVLQPLVENAIRHGIAKISRSGMLTIGAQRSDNELVLSVRNTGPGLDEPVHDGIGLASTRSRLQVLYGDNQRLELREVEGGGVEARIVLPFRLAADSA